MKRNSAGVGGVNGFVIVTFWIAVIAVELFKLTIADDGDENE